MTPLKMNAMGFIGCIMQIVFIYTAASILPFYIHYPLMNPTLTLFPTLVGESYLLIHLLALFCLLLVLPIIYLQYKAKESKVLKAATPLVSLSACFMLISIGFFDMSALDCIPFFILISILVLLPDVFNAAIFGFGKPFLRNLLVHIIFSVIVFPSSMIAYSYATSSVLNRQNLEIKKFGYAALNDLTVIDDSFAKCPLFITGKTFDKKEKNNCWFYQYAIDGDLSQIELYYLSARFGSLSSAIRFFDLLKNDESYLLSKEAIAEKQALIKLDIFNGLRYVNSAAKRPVYDLHQYDSIIDNGIGLNENLKLWKASSGQSEAAIDLSYRLSAIDIMLITRFSN
jgi:hypothetical protein